MANDNADASVTHHFWLSLSKEEVDTLFKNNGILSKELRERFWRIGNYAGEPPEEMQLEVNSADVDRLVEELKSQNKFKFDS